MAARTEDALLQKHLHIPLGIAAGIAAARGTKRKQDSYVPKDPPHRRNGAVKQEPKKETNVQKDAQEFNGWKAGGSRRTPDGKRMEC